MGDEDGIIRKAVCYEKIDTKLNIWYRFGDIQRFYPNWDIPKPSLFYNGKRWREDTPHYLNKAKKAKNAQGNLKSQSSTTKGTITLETRMNLATQETSPTKTFKGATTLENSPHGTTKGIITLETSPQGTFKGVIT